MKNIRTDEELKVVFNKDVVRNDFQERDNSIYFVWKDKNGTHTENVSSKGEIHWTDNEGNYVAKI